MHIPCILFVEELGEAGDAAWLVGKLHREPGQSPVRSQASLKAATEDSGVYVTTAQDHHNTGEWQTQGGNSHYIDGIKGHVNIISTIIIQNSMLVMLQAELTMSCITAWYTIVV